MKKCDTCIYRNNVEQLKPCIIYRDDCEYYEKERGDMSGDLISRDELLKAIDTWDKFGYSARYGLERLDKDDTGYVPYIHYDDVIKCIKGMSSVNPQEPKTCRWIGHREHCENLGVIPSGLGAYKWCSNCDCGIDVKEWHRNNYNYCPNCGCRMVEPQESEVNK